MIFSCSLHIPDLYTGISQITGQRLPKEQSRIGYIPLDAELSSSCRDVAPQESLVREGGTIDISVVTTAVVQCQFIPESELSHLRFGAQDLGTTAPIGGIKEELVAVVEDADTVGTCGVVVPHVDPGPLG